MEVILFLKRFKRTESPGFCVLGAESCFVHLSLTLLAREGVRPSGSEEPELSRLSPTIVGSYVTRQYFFMLLLIVGNNKVIFVVPWFTSISLKADLVLWVFLLPIELQHV